MPTACAPRSFKPARVVCPIVVCALCLVSVGFARAGDAENLRIAVRAYFDAEVAGDAPTIWKLLAPSSQFKKMWSYDAYCAMTQENPVRVKRYVIEEIQEITDNPDPSGMPLVEKIAIVRVHVLLSQKGMPDWERTTIFTFLKEGGAWYKG